MELIEQEKTINKKENPIQNGTHQIESESQYEQIQNDQNSSTVNNEREETISSAKKESKLKKEKITMYSSWQIVLKSFQFATLNWKKDVHGYITTQFQIIFSMYIPLIYGKMIDSITKQKDEAGLYYYFKLYIFVLFCRYIVNQLLRAFNQIFLKYEDIKGQMILLENIAKKDIEFFEVFKTGEIVQRIMNGSNIIYNNFALTVINIFHQGIKAAVILYYLYSFSSVLFFTFLVIIGIRSVNEFIQTELYHQLNREVIYETMDEYFNTITEFISNIRTIKSFSTEERELNIMREQKMKIAYNYLSKSELFTNFKYFLELCDNSVVLLIAGIQTIRGNMTYGDLVVFQKYESELNIALSDIKRTISSFNEMIEEWQRFFEVYDYKPKILPGKDIEPKDLEGKIEFSNVTFSYPLMPSVKILHKLSFTISPGKVFAIVGHSGSGKSTISNLIQRFYDPNEGSILLDDIDVKDLNISWLRRKIGFVAQEPILNSGTIEENIVYGQSNYSKKEIERVCKLANVSSFVQDKGLFPDGLNTLVGERGVKVSGGQKQRIAIARAIIKQCKILVLDEATSALDSESEKEVQNAIDNIIKENKITTVIIAHRLSTIKNADTILFLNKGRIIEQGSHKELLEKNGEYKKLVQNQLI